MTAAHEKLSSNGDKPIDYIYENLIDCVFTFLFIYKFGEILVISVPLYYRVLQQEFPVFPEKTSFHHIIGILPV